MLQSNTVNHMKPSVRETYFCEKILADFSAS